jgi:hypothetical protein
LHVDVKHSAMCLEGGGWRYLSRQHGTRNRAATAGTHNQHRRPLMGTAFVRTVIDDHLRMA